MTVDQSAEFLSRPGAASSYVIHGISELKRGETGQNSVRLKDLLTSPSKKRQDDAMTTIAKDCSVEVATEVLDTVSQIDTQSVLCRDQKGQVVPVEFTGDNAKYFKRGQQERIAGLRRELSEQGRTLGSAPEYALGLKRRMLSAALQGVGILPFDRQDIVRSIVERGKQLTPQQPTGKIAL